MDSLYGRNYLKALIGDGRSLLTVVGAMIAIGSLYLWMAEFPLRNGEAWAWWLFVLSGLAGFGSFLAYLGYGYLDTWHGVATLFLLPCYATGLYRSFRGLTA